MNLSAKGFNIVDTYWDINFLSFGDLVSVD